MATLQGSFHYDGDAADPILAELEVTFGLPVLQFMPDEQATPHFKRRTTGQMSIGLALGAQQADYQVAIPAERLFANSYPALIQYFEQLGKVLLGQDWATDALTIPITVSYGHAGATFSQADSLQALLCVKGIMTASRLSKAVVASALNQDRGASSAALATYIQQNCYLINQAAYTRLLQKAQATEATINSQTLLCIIDLLVDVSDGKPAFRFQDDLGNGEQVATYLARNLRITKAEEVVKITAGSFKELFSFDLTLREQPQIAIAGTLTLQGPGSGTATFADLLRYDLLLAYGTHAAKQTVVPVEVHYNLAGSQEAFDDGTLRFSFTGSQLLLLGSVSGPMTVSVKNFEKTTVWSRDFRPEDPALAELRIAVPLEQPGVLTSTRTVKDDGKRLRGQVVQAGEKCPLKGLTVLVQARRADSALWQIVGAAELDSSGGFSMPYPYGEYVAAQALLSARPNAPATIAVNAETGGNQAIADDFLYLLVDLACAEDEGDDADCDCHDKKTGRLPSQQDLINSDQYTQDIGGACVNLSTPNRTLREYSYHALVRTSDPDVANYTLRKSANGNFDLVSNNHKINRRAVDLTNPIRWQDAPDDRRELSFYQAVTVATGHVLYYKSEFKADGYSLGDLLYSLALAPGQKKEMVIIDSQHGLLGAETQAISQGESLAASLQNERSITDQLAGSLGEAMQGSSTASTSGVSAGLGVGVSYGGIGASLGVAGGTSKSSASASQNSSRDVSQFFGERLRQSVMQNADSYRQLNASVVTSVQEKQSYRATTDVVANHNHCHSLTMLYFEVLRHFAVFQELVGVEECVFVPLLMTNFTTENIFKWADVLARHLLPMAANTYLKPHSFFGGRPQHPLLKAFDANERIKTGYAQVDFPTGTYDQDPIEFITGTINLRTNLARPKTKYDRIKSLPVITKTVTKKVTDVRSVAKSVVLGALTGGLSFLAGSDGSHTVKEDILVREKIFDAFMHLDDNYESVPPARCIRIINFRSVSIPAFGTSQVITPYEFFKDGLIDGKLWEAYAAILGYTDVLAMLEYYFQGRLIAEWDDIYYQDIAPLLFERIVDSIKLEALSTDMSTSVAYRGGERLMQLTFTGGTSKNRRELSTSLGNTMELYSNSSVVKGLKGLVLLSVENVRIAYSTAHFNGLLYNGNPKNDLLDGVTLYIPENADEKKDPRKEDRYLAKKLIEHLNSHLEHYNKALWYNLDPDRRYMLLDGFNIQIFNSFGLPAGYRSLASVVKNQLLTIVGNSLVLPVAPGYKVSQDFIMEEMATGVQQEVSLLNHYQPLTPVPPYRISVPTRGVFMEALQGACDACEKVKENSSQDWTKFTTDEPTPISPVTPIVPTITDWKAAFKDFATPIVNIQNAPATPEPGAGLAGLTELLGKAGIFKDITGLDATQQTALKTYLSNQENAKAFAEMAKGMAMQSHNTEHSGNIMDTLKTAKDTGALSDADYKQLVKEHAQQLIDGGASKKAELDQQKATQTPALIDKAAGVANQGKNVKATTADADGKVETVEITNGGSGLPVLAQVTGSVPRLKQPNDMACWATAATMMVSWKQAKTLPVLTVLQLAGEEYVQKFNQQQGLLSSEKTAFITVLGMVGEPPANYTLQQYIDWLRDYGPLWITTDSSEAEGMFSPHARILVRIEGTGNPDGNGTNFVYNDPATGSEKTETFLEFVQAFEQMVTDNPDDLFIQVVHFQDKLTGGEGYSIEGPWNIGEPVHENITLAALIHSTVGVSPGTKVNSDKTVNEFFRGVIWNDDPAILLFDENKKDNWDFSSGYTWKQKFDAAGKAKTNNLQNLTGRSHYWDLQFLHAMGSALGEDPADTQAKILLWAEVMYKFAIGEGLASTDLLKTVSVSTAFGATTYTLNSFFTLATDPTESDTLNKLLNRDTKCVWLDNSRRAIGSVMHIIQDSCAKGHTRRTLRNPGDLLPGSTDKFVAGTFGDYGDIENFHCYKGQDHKAHEKYDTFNASKFNTSKLETFNELNGARNAIDYCIKLLDFWQAHTPYASGPKALFEDSIFKLSPAATPSDTTV